MRSSTRMRMISPKTSTVPPPRFLAWYMAASALESRGVASDTRVAGAGHADAGRQEDLALAGRDGGPQGVQRPLGVGHGVALGVVAVEEDQELVAAQPGDDVGRAVGPRQAPRHRHQHLVADLVAEAVVDGLEAVEVEDEHGHRARGALALGQRVGQTVGEQGPVGQARERVVQIGVGQGLLGRLVLVLVVEEAADAQVVPGADDVGRRQDLDLVALTVQQVELLGPRPPMAPP